MIYLKNIIVYNKNLFQKIDKEYYYKQGIYENDFQSLIENNYKNILKNEF